MIFIPYVNKDHVYSYSQLTSFSECPYEFFLERLEKDENGNRLIQEPNAFSEHGTLIHDIIDKWAKGELKKEELTLEYDLRFDEEVVTPFPKLLKEGYREKAYQLGYNYFASFDEFSDLKILETEKRFTTTIADRKFVGVIDMIAEDKKTGELIILDHKSKSKAAFKKDENNMYRQQLLYSKWVSEEYNRYPDILMFNLFKENGLRMQRKFTLEDFCTALKWAENMIHDIESFEMLDFLDTKQPDFFCQELCSMRKYCDNGTYKPKR